MPSLPCEVEFEAYCGQCGAGICGNVSTRTSRTRAVPQLVIEPCRRCIEAAAEGATDAAHASDRKEIDDLQATIDELRERLETSI